MSYRTTLALAAVLVTFALVLIGSVMAQTGQSQASAAASAAVISATDVPTMPPATAPAETTVAPIAAPAPVEDASIALLKERELEYRKLIEEANARLKVANDRIRVANRQQQSLLDQLKRAYAKQQELAQAQCTAAQP